MYKATLRCEYAQCNVPEFMLLLVTALGCMWKGVFPKELRVRDQVICYSV